MNLNGKPINPGELRTQVAVGPRSVTTAPGGARVPGFAAQATVWAKWKNAHGSEAVQAATEGIERLATVTIRYRSGLDETWGVRLGSDWYEILSMDDIEQRHEYIELKVKLWRAA